MNLLPSDLFGQTVQGSLKALFLTSSNHPIALQQLCHDFAKTPHPLNPRRLRAHLRRGGLVAYPTESCYGLGAAPDNRRALNKILRLKKRPQGKGLIVAADSLQRLRPLLRPLSAADSRELESVWPAAKTFILPAARRVLPELRGRGRSKLAVRVPDHALVRRLCALAGMPLVSTSCNRSGGRSCKSEREARRLFGR